MRFSIIIPAYRRRFLAEAVRSALAQDRDDLEVLVYDDASPERLEELMGGLGDPRLRYHRGERNLGAADPSAAWNQALQLARGEYITLLGDDDLLDSNYLEEMDALIKRQPEADIYRCRLRLIDEAGGVTALGFPLAELESWDEFLYFRNAGKRAHSTAEMCLRGTALRAMGGWAAMPAAIGSDDLSYLRLAALGGVASTNACWASWRTHRRQISTSRKYEAARVRAVRELGRRELAFIEGHEAKNISRELLLSSLPGLEKRPLLDSIRSVAATWAGKIGLE